MYNFNSHNFCVTLSILKTVGLMVGVDVGISVGTVDGMYVGAIDRTEVFTDVAFEVEVS